MSAACASGSTSEGGGVAPNYQNPLFHGVSVPMNDLRQDLAFEAIVPPTGTFGTPSNMLVDVSNAPRQRSVVFQYNLSPDGLVNVGESIWDGGNWTDYVDGWVGTTHSSPSLGTTVTGNAVSYQLPDGSIAIVRTGPTEPNTSTIEWLGPGGTIYFAITGPSIPVSDAEQLASSLVNPHIPS
jgi:hypothetical protein